MQADPHPDREAFGPGMFCEDSLYGCGSRNCISGTGKGDKEGISLGINLVTIVLLEYAVQRMPTVGQHVGIVLPQLLQEARRVFSIGEEQCNGSGG